jgi:predicted transcriptional regulator
LLSVCGRAIGLEQDYKKQGLIMASQEHSAPRAEDLLKLASDIVSAYVSNNPVPAADLPNMIRSVHATLGGLSGDGMNEGIPGGHKPAVPVKKSITPDYVICLEDGKKLKMLKRHLRTAYSMTPEEYRIKWGLPADYPMVAPNYAAKRSEFAKKIGLGRSAAPVKRRR